jgi:hypothetical protein
MTEPVDSKAIARRDVNVTETRGLDSVDTCLRRLLSLRTRIDTNWPEGGWLFTKGHELKPETEALIADLLTSLPTPLPLVAGGSPEPIIKPSDEDLRYVAGRAVDAAFALLDGTTLETPYPGDVTMLGTRRYDSAGPIAVSKPTVGLLVATIIGTLEAISELIVEPVRTKKPAPSPAKPQKQNKAEKAKFEPKRGPSVPRI